MGAQFPLEGKVALVTGASSGIGRATAEILARDGAKVVLVARRQKRLAKIKEEIEDDYGSEALVCPADVSVISEVDAAVEMTIDVFGRLDIAVSNAGIVTSNNTSVNDLGLDEYHNLVDVNINGTYYVTRAVLMHLAKANGNMIYVGSFDGHFPRPQNPIYTASKWWLRGFAHSLEGPAGEGGIGVTVVNPAKVRTEIGPAGEKTFKEKFSMGEVLEPEDVAEAIAFAARQKTRATLSEIDVFTRDKYAREGF